MENRDRITPGMTVLEVIYRYRQTEEVFNQYDAIAGVCLCCQALFDSVSEVAGKYNLDLEQLMTDLEQAASRSQVISSAEE